MTGAGCACAGTVRLAPDEFCVRADATRLVPGKFDLTPGKFHLRALPRTWWTARSACARLGRLRSILSLARLGAQPSCLHRRKSRSAPGWRDPATEKCRLALVACRPAPRGPLQIKTRRKLHQRSARTLTVPGAMFRRGPRPVTNPQSALRDPPDRSTVAPDSMASPCDWTPPDRRG